jgi:ABC-type transport system involved in cytochrome c biogenesis ATPase subunit
MLTAIRRIQGLGVFGDFTPNAELPEFGRYNIVYGENGSGKTTLSRLLGCLEAGGHAEYADLQFSIDSQSGVLVSHPTGKGFDPALVAETQKNVTFLLEMIKNLDSLHY